MPLKAMAARIARCAGPSGTNFGYVLRLAEALRTHATSGLRARTPRARHLARSRPTAGR